MDEYHFQLPIGRVFTVMADIAVYPLTYIQGYMSCFNALPKVLTENQMLHYLSRQPS